MRKGNTGHHLEITKNDSFISLQGHFESFEDKENILDEHSATITNKRKEMAPFSRHSFNLAPRRPVMSLESPYQPNLPLLKRQHLGCNLAGVSFPVLLTKKLINELNQRP